MVYDYNTGRIAVGIKLCDQLRTELGEHCVATAIYGSVAHSGASLHSDVEVQIITDPTIEYHEGRAFIDGIQTEWTVCPRQRMLAAAQRVTPAWGIQADAYRVQHVVWDPHGFFDDLHAKAHDLSDTAFALALAEGWWLTNELHGKAVNAIRESDWPRAVYSSWEFTYQCALRIALYECQPFESLRTLWHDVAQRGYGMPALIRALTMGDHASLQEELATVWAVVGKWGNPNGDQGSVSSV